MAEFKDYGSYTTASSGAAMLINRAPHPNAATIFLNWVLSKEGQWAWSKAMKHAVFANYLKSAGLTTEESVAGHAVWDKHIKEEYAGAAAALKELGLIK